MKKLIYIFSILISIVSCRVKPIDIEVKSSEPKLVAFSQVIPDNIMIIMLTKSFSPLDGITADQIEQTLISGATVKVFSNNQTFDFYEINPGIYASFENAFSANESYNFTAIYDGDTISSTTTMLPKVPFTSVTPNIEKLTSDTNVYLDIAFNDIPDVVNYYMINVYRKNGTSSVTDINTFFQNGKNALAKTILVSDKEFNQSYQHKFKIDQLLYNDSISVTLSNINKDYFDYLNLTSNNASIFSQLQIEPVSYPTNIINGYGFFNAHYPDILFYDLSEY